jgi:hypothetical protein
VHNRRQSSSPSGEDRVLADDVAALRRVGLTAMEWFKDSDTITASSSADTARVVTCDRPSHQ